MTVLVLPGYVELEEIGGDASLMLLRAVRADDGRQVTLKLARDERAALRDVARLTREYETIRTLRSECFPTPLGLEFQNQRMLLVLGGFGTSTLATRIAQGRLPMRRCLTLAIQLATALSEVHHAGLIHRAVEPGNVLVDSASDTLKLMGFGQSTRRSRDDESGPGSRLPEGNLAYISPEHTGRMNRRVDHRTDMYSLGVTLFELFTGRLPFETHDPLELVHSHIAVPPPAPSSRAPAVPRMLDAVVLKLLEKAAEHRYQSMEGLLADLEECRHQLTTTNTIKEFTPGGQDFSTRFAVPQRLYGRDIELAALGSAFERVATGGRELVLVSGDSGIGKTVLIKEVQRPLAERRGLMVQGKSEQFRRDAPFAPVLQAFAALLRGLLTQSDEALARWRVRLNAQLGPNSQPLVDALPELQTVLGPQPPAPPRKDEQELFEALLEAFLRAFCREDQPFVLFLDDLQWADSSTLRFIERVLLAPDLNHLLVIGAYRHKEVPAHHPLRGAIERVRGGGVQVEEIRVTALPERVVNDLIADTLLVPPGETARLTALVHRKTAGNPFFLVEFLHHLHRREGFRFDVVERRWRWNLPLIESMDVTDNVVELMTQALHELPEPLHEVLRLAACVGHRFSLRHLAHIRGTSALETARALAAPVEAGVLLLSGMEPPLTDEPLESSGFAFDGASTQYRFVHDRVQQAAYELGTEEERARMHLAIARSLTAIESREPSEDRLFEIVGQFNRSLPLLKDPTERLRALELNAAAGVRAARSLAAEAGLNYLDNAIALLPADAWTSLRERTLSLYLDAAETALQARAVEQMTALTGVVLEHARTPLEAAPAHSIRIRHYAGGWRELDRCIDTARIALDSLGFSLPAKAHNGHIVSAVLRARLALRGKTIDDLRALPEMTDERVLAIMVVSTDSLLGFYNKDPLAFALQSLRLVQLSVEHGNSKHCALAFVVYGIILMGFGEFEKAQEFGAYGLELVERYEAEDIAPQVHASVHATFTHWVTPFPDMRPELAKTIELCREQGASVWYTIAQQIALQVSLFGGRALQPTIRDGMANLEENQADSLSAMFHVQSSVLVEGAKRLAGTSPGSGPIDLTPFIAQLQDASDDVDVHRSLRRVAASANMFHSTYMGDHATALQAGAFEEASWTEIASTPFALPHTTCWALVHAASVDAGTVPRGKALRVMRKMLKRLVRWEPHCPHNVNHRRLLVEAEIARVEGRHQDAFPLYEQAIEAARRTSHLGDAGLAAERAARLQLSLGSARAARAYLTDAAYDFARWGANAKVQALHDEFPYLGDAVDTSRSIERTPQDDSLSLPVVADMDLAAVMRASRVISSEIVLEKLLASLMRIVLQNAGAERGMLLRPRDGTLKVEAEAHVGTGAVQLLGRTPVSEHPRVPLTIINYVTRARQHVVLGDAARVGQFQRDRYIRESGMKSVLAMPLFHQDSLTAVLYLENNLGADTFTPDRLETLSMLCSQAEISIRNAELYTHQLEMTKASSRFVPSEFLNILGHESIVDVELGEQVQREMTVLFTDIRDFTALSEQLTPQETFNLVNTLLHDLGPTIRHNNGFIDKYIGDGIMALFPDGAADALAAARDLQAAVDGFNAIWTAQGNAALRVGIGVHSGPLMLGTVGEEARMEGTVISDVVNVASRIEGLNKRYGSTCLISEASFQQIPDRDSLAVRYLGKLPMKGRSRIVGVYEVLDVQGAPEQAARRESVALFEESRLAMEAGRTAEALDGFQRILDQDPADRAAGYFISLLEQPVSGVWEPVDLVDMGDSVF